jgi:hypothetical protein
MPIIAVILTTLYSRIQLHNTHRHVVPSRIAARRGVAETTTTLLLVVVVVIGGVMATVFFQSTTSALTESVDNTLVFAGSADITGYDTRDGSDLSEITTLDNKISNGSVNQKLCTISCASNTNAIPSTLLATSGTEFIVLKIKNTSTGTTTLGNIVINDVDHEWDSDTAGITFTAVASIPPIGSALEGSYPRDGKYSIIPLDNTLPITQRSSTQLEFGEEVRVVVKLSGSIESDISISQPIRVRLDAGGDSDSKFTILSGSLQ